MHKEEGFKEVDNVQGKLCRPASFDSFAYPLQETSNHPRPSLYDLLISYRLQMAVSATFRNTKDRPNHQTLRPYDLTKTNPDRANPP